MPLPFEPEARNRNAAPTSVLLPARAATLGGSAETPVPL
jgi:hypothetical protein